MNVEVRNAKTAAEQALSAAFAAARDTLPGKGAIAKLREDGVRALRRERACRTGASRNGNTPICAR